MVGEEGSGVEEATGVKAAKILLIKTLMTILSSLKFNVKKICHKKVLEILVSSIL